jgi:acyl dehydratase
MSNENNDFLLSCAEQFIDKPLGISDWVDIDQIQVNIFGEVSRWRKDGHCDPESAKKGPYGGTLIHGFHMVSLLSYFFENAVSKPKDASHSLNYGLDKVRVLKPVVIGDGVRLRSHVSLLEATDKGEGQRLLKTCHQIEVQGIEGYVMYAEYLAYWYPLVTAQEA